jgi:DNA replication protein DnaC
MPPPRNKLVPEERVDVLRVRPQGVLCTSALLDRLLHHAETVIIEGKSFRMKDQLES